MIKTYYEKGPFARGARPIMVELREIKTDFREDMYDAWVQLKIDLVELKVSYNATMRLCILKETADFP